MEPIDAIDGSASDLVMSQFTAGALDPWSTGPRGASWCRLQFGDGTFPRWRL